MPDTTTKLLEGCEAIADAMIASDCRFFAGYPMTPFTEVLEHMAAKLPAVGGVCMNAESELEAVGMAWGAAAAGVRAATGSCGQGLSLMQESLAEITLAGVPLVVFNMARGQSDYWQATRGGGHGDYRHLVLAPMDVPEAVAHVQLAFELSDRWRNPVLIYGDYYLAHTHQTVAVPAAPPAPDKPWALDGRTGGTGHARIISPLGSSKRKDRVGFDLQEHYLEKLADTQRMLAGVEPLADIGFCTDAEVVVVAFGTVGKFVRYVVGRLRAQGHRVGYVRPITLVPFPSAALAAAVIGARVVAVHENSSGQMIDDVRLALEGAVPTRFIGGVSLDRSGFGIGPDITVEETTRRILAVLEAT